MHVILISYAYTCTIRLMEPLLQKIICTSRKNPLVPLDNDRSGEMVRSSGLVDHHLLPPLKPHVSSTYVHNHTE